MASTTHVTDHELPGTQTAQHGEPIDVRGCAWQQDLRRIGIEPELPALFRIGVPALVLAVLGSAALVEVLTATSGARSDALFVALVLAAGLPWMRWSPRDDNGPDLTFACFALTPLVALGIAQWIEAPFALNADLAYLLATFPLLLTALLYVGFASVRLAVGVTIASYLAFGVPLLAGRLAGTAELDMSGLAAWQMSFAFSLVAGYSIRLGYRMSQELAAAREELAWQALAEDRRRVARDVHDVVAHTLAVTMLHITAARMAVRRADPAQAEEALEEAERQGRASLADIRRVVRLLRSDGAPTLQTAQPGMADIDKLVAHYRAAGLPVELSFKSSTRTCSPATGMVIYAVLQEALANAARHGRGTASVSLATGGEHLVIQVTNPIDDATRTRLASSGLIGMQERVAAVGGTLEAGPRDGLWAVKALIPAGVAP